MTKRKKGASRILALLLSVMMFISMLPMTAMAKEARDAAPALQFFECQSLDSEVNKIEKNAENADTDYTLYSTKEATLRFKLSMKAKAEAVEHKVWFASLNKNAILTMADIQEVSSDDWTECWVGNDACYIVVGSTPPEKEKDGKNQKLILHEDVNTVYTVERVALPCLKSLEIENNNTLSPAFQMIVLDYTAEVPYDASEIKITLQSNISKTGTVAWYVNDDEEPINPASLSETLKIGEGTDIPWNETGEIQLKFVTMNEGKEGLTYTLKLVRSYQPTILQQPVSSKYTDTDTPNPLTLTVPPCGGELTFQWYKNDTNSSESGTPIEGATAESYTPVLPDIVNSTRSRTEYYYCIVTNTVNGDQYTAVSDIASIITKPYFEVTVQRTDEFPLPEDRNDMPYFTDGAPAPELTVAFDNTVDGGVGEWTYEWAWTYSDEQGLKQKNVVGTEREFTPPTDLHGALIYTCYVTHTIDGVAETFESQNSVYIRSYFTSAEEPIVVKQPESAEYIVGNTAEQLSVQFSPGNRIYRPAGSVNYQGQWQSSSDNITWTDIPDGKSPYFYTPETDKAGITYYRVRVQSVYTPFDKGSYVSETVYSEPAVITVKPYEVSFEGTGSEDDPYLIESAEDLLQLKTYVEDEQISFSGTYFRITNDITLPNDWTPIGTKEGGDFNCFNGILDGGGTLLTIPEGGKALFNYSQGGTLRNLNIYGPRIDDYAVLSSYSVGVTITIENVTLKSGTKTLYSGFLGGFASGQNKCMIRNCTLEQGVTIGYDRSQSNIGGFAGEYNGYIENCTSYADVYGVNYVGGIVGNKGQTIGPFEIRNCQFHGTVNATGNYAGGIAGGGYAGTGFGVESAPNTPCATIQNCYSAGAVRGNNYVGGILGAEPGVRQCWENGTGYIQSNLFTGTVTATSGSYIGGIIGYMNSLDRYNVISNNYYSSSCGTDKGIGGTILIDTNCETVDQTDDSISYVSTEEYCRTDDPFGADADKLAKMLSPEELKSDEILDALNKGEGSFGNWVPGEDGPIHSNKAVINSLTLGGQYRTIYYIDDELDVSGLTITANWSDGKKSEVKTDDVTFTGFDSSTKGVQIVTVTYGSVQTMFTVTVYDRPGEDIAVSFTLLGDTKHGAGTESHTLAGGNLTEWITPTEFTINNNATVWDLIQLAFEQNQITCSNPTGNYIESVTHNGVTLCGMDNGINSGWLYTINGVYSDLGVAEQFLSNGDVIVFHYTDDYTREGTFKEPEQTAEDVIALINAIGTVTLDSGDAISAARTAYDSLSAEEKGKVTNYATLTAAEKAYAQMIQDKESFEEVYKATGDYLASLGTPGVGSIGGEWSVLGLARSGREVQEEYYNAVVAFIRENINDNEQIHPAKSTENSRIILALTALGMDVTDVDGHNLLQGLTDMDYVTAQGINGPIFALIAFDSHKYEIPAGDVTRDKLIAYILGEQLSDGGWALSGNTSDPDTTAMALQALAPYYKTNADVKAVVDKALVCLSDMQQPTGGYSSWGTTNAESCAQVIVALTALGIDPDNDSRFIKNGASVLDALLSFAVEDGGFKHVLDGGRNQMATEQGYYALVAYDRFLNDKTSLYNMSDVTINTDPDVPVPEDKDITLTDVTGTGVTVISKESILNGMELEAKLLTSGELYDKVKEALKDGKFTLYDLYLLENNLEVQPDGTITVSIPVPDGYDGTKCNVYRVNEDGSVTEITAALKDGKLVFETDQMGAFAIYQPAAVEPTNPDGNGGTTDSPQTGDSSNVAMWFAMSLLSLAALTVLSRKKKTVK